MSLGLQFLGLLIARSRQAICGNITWQREWCGKGQAGGCPWVLDLWVRFGESADLIPVPFNRFPGYLFFQPFKRWVLGITLGIYCLRPWAGSWPWAFRLPGPSPSFASGMETRQNEVLWLLGKLTGAPRVPEDPREILLENSKNRENAWWG